MQKILFLFLFLYPVLSYSQSNINKSKAAIKKEIEKFKKKNQSYTINISETDSSLLIVETDPEKNRTERLLQFDKARNCKSDALLFNCSSCYKKELARLLAIEKYGWKKINENQYISKFEDKLMIELPTENQSNSITIIRTDWTKILYDMLSGK